MIERQGAITGAKGKLFTGWIGGVIRAWAVLAIVLTVLSAIEVLPTVGLFWPARDGAYGYDAKAVVGRPGWQQIVSVTAGGAAAQAGARAPMLIRFDQPSLAQAQTPAGRMAGVTLIGATAAGQPSGKPRHAILIAQPAVFGSQPLGDRVNDITLVFGQWLAIALALLALIRGWGSVTALALGFGMLAFASILVAPIWATSPGVAAAMLCLNAMVTCGGVGLMALPVVLHAERIGPLPLAWRVVYAVITAIWWADCGLRAWCLYADAAYPIVGNGELIFGIALLVLNLPALYWCWRGGHAATGADKNRFSTLAAATVFLTVVGAQSLAWQALGTDTLDRLGMTGATGLTIATNVLVPLSLAYAVLRHRVIDLGFVINRTLVFGTVSAILLALFGLIEWGTEHLLPESWIKASAWIDAGAAVVVYLAFHRVHGAVETRVEKIVFQNWHANADTLRRFVHSAAHFEDERALSRSFADELSRFAGDAKVAVYRRKERSHDAILERNAGSWDTVPRTLPIDDPAFALMRAERRALDLSDVMTDLPGVLALPMLDHGTLAGVVLMDLKGNGALYRPDEVEVLGWAAHDVALALAALHAGLIEAENRLLKAQLARLGSLIGDRLDHVGA